MKKRFSMRNKLLIIFGVLVALATSIEGLLAIRTARKAVIEKIETHLIDKATDTAEIIDGRITAFWQFLEGIARMPHLKSPAYSYEQKAAVLHQEAAANKEIRMMSIGDLNGNLYTKGQKTIDVSAQRWFHEVCT